jgi:restriction system protein
MSIPDYQDCMLPLLQVVADKKDHTFREIVQVIADRFELSEGQRQEMLQSGSQTVITNRVGWAKTYLKKAGLIANPTRGTIRITAEGLKVLASKPAKIDSAFLKKYDSFRVFISPSSIQSSDVDQAESTATPEESIAEANRTLRAKLADELLDKLMQSSPTFFERLVVELLVAMGYGGSLADVLQAVGKSGDDGIDGIIKEDRLGLDVVCIQAKRWSGPVGRPAVQAFAGSMEGNRARKGVLFTTSSFTKEAEEYVSRIERKIVLVDGRRLADLMIEHNIGVAVDRLVEIKRIDQDYFESDEE